MAVGKAKDTIYKLLDILGLIVPIPKGVSNYLFMLPKCVELFHDIKLFSFLTFFFCILLQFNDCIYAIEEEKILSTLRVFVCHIFQYLTRKVPFL